MLACLDVPGSHVSKRDHEAQIRKSRSGRVRLSRVVSYANLDGEAYCESAAFKEIVNLEIYYSTSPWEESVITVETRAGSAFYLLVSNREKKDRLFYEALVGLWREKASHQAQPVRELQRLYCRRIGGSSSAGAAKLPRGCREAWELSG